MHRDGADLARMAKTDVLPGLPGVGRAVHPVADGDVAARAGGAGAHIDDVDVRGSHLDGAHRAHSQEAVRDVRPVMSGVGRLVHPAAGAAEVVGQRIAGDSDRRGGAPPTREADRPEPHLLEVLRRHGDVRFIEVLVVVAMTPLPQRERRGERDGHGKSRRNAKKSSNVHREVPPGKSRSVYRGGREAAAGLSDPVAPETRRPRRASKPRAPP